MNFSYKSAKRADYISQLININKNVEKRMEKLEFYTS
jgi:hypothetical protein